MKQSKLIKLNLKFKYLTLELQEDTETYQQYMREWDQVIFSLEQEFKTSLIDRIEKNVKKNSEASEQNKYQHVRALSGEEHEQMKNLYYQAAKQVHPDRSGGDDDMMQQVNQAYESDNLAKLIEICLDLNVDMSTLTEEHVKLIEKNILAVQDEIKRLRTTQAWIFCTSTESQKNNIINNIKNLLSKRISKE